MRHRHLPQGKWRDVPGDENFDLPGQFEIKAIGDRLLKMAGNPSCDEIAFEERMTPPAYIPALRGSPTNAGSGSGTPTRAIDRACPTSARRTAHVR